MYYKVLSKTDVVDVLKNIIYAKYQSHHNINILCDIKEAEAVLSYNGKSAWHMEGLYDYEPDNQLYTIEPIKRREFKEYKEKLNIE